MPKIQAVWGFFKLLVKNYSEDGCQSTAAALTYQTLFAVVPLLTITYTVLEAFEAFSGVGDLLQDFVFDNVVPESVSVVQEYIQQFSSQAMSLSGPSLIVVGLTAFLMMHTIEKSFNDIWRIREPRQGFQRILMYWAILTLGPVLMFLGLASTTYLFSLPIITGVGASKLFGIVPLALSTVFFTLMYVAVPNCQVPFRHGVIAAAVVAVGFELVKHLFGSVMAMTDFAVIYGTYAAVPLFLIWLYVSWTIVLFGAELNKNMGLFRSQRSPQMEPPLVQILIILHEFFRCHRLGEVVTDRTITSLSHRVDMQAWHDYKSRLLTLGLIRVVEKGGLVLSKDLNEVTLWSLYRDLPWPLPAGFTVAGEAWEKQVNEKLTKSFEERRVMFELDLEQLYRGEKS
ncbi:MAG: YihY family inner membrane protein [Gammaproteobacteria bacterium]|jgi:membrane protein|nr:YihY family inner membrane protein [Gammaproteobacteria bacterium]MBT5723298.1 YihY family inner membrane protein [Gammaproteobacteria bacterium]MBT6584820.1 YihY family inner membrane protein [Gammaproteobacteria bacterium]MBT6890448.1 YihY family inner membrane protein [Gammaproteobacteria bacterium]MBT7880659.1 YihY family inner membrane protein [Gammaproteobacteria bacterium]